MTKIDRKVLFPLFVMLAIGCSDGSKNGGSEPPPCQQAAPQALRTCVATFSATVAQCYEETGEPCASEDSGLSRALEDLGAEVEQSCASGDFALLSGEALVGRLQNACSSEASSLAWRTYGGPQGAVWPKADNAARGCLSSAHAIGADLIDESLDAIEICFQSGDCDAIALRDERASLAETARQELEEECPALSGLIAVDPTTYIARAEQQTDCLTATSRTDTGEVELNCGPSNAEFDPPRGEYVQVVVDGDKWGTLCGDGSDYAFYVRLAPEGAPLDRILIGLQGGGVCLFEGDCTARLESNPGLFNAMDDLPIGAGIASNDPEESPFADWTKVYLPYCNQDVFAGGGVYEPLGALSMPRFGSVNLRAAIQMARDVIWKKMDAQEGPGFRPDEIIALFGGWSAGAYGTIYNYHWTLDDLQWPRTAAFPDAGLALDNGSALGVRGLGLVKIPAWGTLHNLPAYCFEGDCAVGPVLYEAISPRLKQVPEQQLLILSNPEDDTQRNDAFFTEEALWMNTFRESYCSTKDLPGINYYFTSVSDRSVHVVTLRPDLWQGEVDGETMRDWFWRAVTEPNTLQNRVEEGDFVDTVPGTEPYPCEVAP